MTKSIRSVLGYWIRAVDLCKRNFLLVLLIALIDVLFFFVLGFATSYFVDRIFELAVVVTQRISSELSIESTSGLLGILFQPGIASITWQIIGFMFMTLLVTFVTYVIIQGYAWYLSQYVMGKVSWPAYLKRFTKVNVLWFALFALFFVVNTLVDLRYTIVANIAQATKPVLPFVPIYAFLLVIIYLAFTSYGLPSIRESWRVAKRPTTLITFLSVLLLLGLFDGLIILLAWLGGGAALFVSLLGLPLISIVRWVMIQSSQDSP